MATLYGLQRFYQRGLYGDGVQIAFVEFAAPSAPDDAAFWADESLDPRRNTPVRCVDVGSAASDPGAEGETDLDLQYAGALAPGARLTAYLISDRGTPAAFLGAMYDALYQAASDGAQIVSISLGTSDRLAAAAGEIASARNGVSWPDAASFATAFDDLVTGSGMAVFAASGDSGAYGGSPFGDDRPQPIWPAVQPSVIAVGGTQLAHPGDVAQGETAWGGQTLGAQLPGYDPANTLPTASGGGGVSSFLDRPRYQGLSYRGRATPDMAAYAGPLRIVLGGFALAVWGTSAAAPIAAATAALWRQATGRNVDHGILYGCAADILKGNNWNNQLAEANLRMFYGAAPGYDLCTGAGVLRADRLPAF